MQQIKIIILSLFEPMSDYRKPEHIEKYENEVNDFLAKHPDATSQSFVLPSGENYTRFTTIINYEKEAE